ncbi:uncharacterized protein B0T15DRAFT_395501, partial [Chaetomium strumarium]
PDEVSPMAPVLRSSASLASPDGALSRCEEAILNCFPDICLEYLRNEAPTYGWDSERLMDHLLNQQEKGTPYPRANILKRKRPEKDEADGHAEMRRKFEMGDPRRANKAPGYVEHYTNATKKLLKAAFPQCYAEDIEKLLKDNDYRLYTTYQMLDEAGWNTEARQMRVKKSFSTRAQPGEELRNSVIEAEKDAVAEFDAASADCRAQAEARAAKKAEKERREREEAENLERAKSEGSVAECGCCFDEFALNRMTHCNGSEVHWFCYSCSRRMAETVIGLTRYQLDCMSTEGCDGTFTKDQKELFLDANLTTALDRNEQEAVLRMAGIENLATCPFCPYAAEYPPVEVNKEFRCDNPDCGLVSCRLCRQETHIPKTCEEVTRERGQSARRTIEEAMSAALIRTCNKCGTPFIKENGCNKMMCSRPGCGNMQCYVCSQSCRDYSHFNDPTRGGKSGNCPLFDNVEQRHQTEVQAAEERARRQVVEENPEVEAELLEIRFSESVKKDDEKRKVATAGPRRPILGPPPIPYPHVDRVQGPAQQQRWAQQQRPAQQQRQAQPQGPAQQRRPAPQQRPAQQHGSAQQQGLGPHAALPVIPRQNASVMNDNLFDPAGSQWGTLAVPLAYVPGLQSQQQPMRGGNPYNFLPGPWDANLYPFLPAQAPRAPRAPTP